MEEIYVQKPWMQVGIRMYKIIISLLLVSIFLVSTVNAIGLSPLHLELSMERGKETEVVETIRVLNSEQKSLHVTAKATGSIAEFATVEPEEFDIPAGPGPLSSEARPYQYVTVMFTIPREVPESKYTGEILFTEQPTTGGVLGTAVQLGVTVKLDIGTVAPAEFPLYVMIMLLLLVVSILLSIFYKSKIGFNKTFVYFWVYSVLCLVLILLYKYYTNIFDSKIAGYNLSLWSALVVNVILIIFSLLSFKESKMISILGIVFAVLSTYLFYESWTNYVYEYLVGFMAIPIILLALSFKKKQK